MTPPAEDGRQASPASPDPEGVHYPRWLWLVGLAVVVVVGLAVTALVIIGSADTDQPEPAVIERLIPSNNSQVLRQEPMGIDLAPGYDASLTVNGTPIPEAQLERTEGLNIVLFRPGQGQVIDQLPAGQSCVTATYWRMDTGPVESRSQSWCFTAL